MNKYLIEVEEKLRQFAPEEKLYAYADLQSYMGTGYELLGIRSATQKEIFRKGFSFSNLPLNKQLKIWTSVWNESNLFEALSQAGLFILKYQKKIPMEEFWKVTKTWTRKIDNWAHSDTLSSVFANLLLKNGFVYDQLEKWNSSRNVWERRQSVVTMAIYYRKSDVIPFQKSIRFVNSLIGDEDYFVEKGIGWMLREMGTKFPKEHSAFLSKNCARLSSSAFATATERIGPGEKEILKTIRRQKCQHVV
ncbi:MAG: DNA alkylation repair protein [Bacteroidia bacterium]